MEGGCNLGRLETVEVSITLALLVVPIRPDLCSEGLDPIPTGYSRLSAELLGFLIHKDVPGLSYSLNPITTVMRILCPPQAIHTKNLRMCPYLERGPWRCK